MSNNEKQVFLKYLIGRIFKILPLAEKNNNLIPKIYVQRLILDLNSANSLFDNEFINIIVKLNVLYENNLPHPEIRSVVFDCINYVKKNIK